MRTIILSHTVDVPSGTEYASVWSDNPSTWAGAGTKDIPMPVSGTIQNLRVVLTTAPGAGTSRTFELQKNGGSTGVSVTISNTDVTASNTVDTEAFSAGDYYSLEHTQSGVPASSGAVAFSFEVVATNSLIGAHSRTLISATTRMPLMGTGTSTTASVVGQYIPANGTLKNLYARLNSTLSSGSYDVTLYVNGSPTALTTNLASGTQNNSDTTHTVSVSRGDGVYMEITANTPSNNRAVAFGMEFVSDVANESITMSNATANPSTLQVTSMMGAVNTWSSTGNARQHVLGDDFVFRDFYAVLTTAPGASQSRLFETSFDEGTDGEPSITISGTNTTGSNTATDSQTTVAGDPYNLAFSNLGTSPASSTPNYFSWVVFDDQPGTTTSTSSTSSSTSTSSTSTSVSTSSTSTSRSTSTSSTSTSLSTSSTSTSTSVTGTTTSTSLSTSSTSSSTSVSVSTSSTSTSTSLSTSSTSSSTSTSVSTSSTSTSVSSSTSLSTSSTSTSISASTTTSTSSTSVSTSSTSSSTSSTTTLPPDPRTRPRITIRPSGPSVIVHGDGIKTAISSDNIRIRIKGRLR